jgi:hypothetical protein
MGSGFLRTGNPHGFRVPKNGEPAWIPGSLERGTRMGSGFLRMENPEPVPSLSQKAVEGYVNTSLCLKMHKNGLWDGFSVPGNPEPTWISGSWARSPKLTSLDDSILKYDEVSKCPHKNVDKKTSTEQNAARVNCRKAKCRHGEISKVRTHRRTHFLTLIFTLKWQLYAKSSRSKKKRAKKTSILHDKLNKLRTLYDSDVIISVSTACHCYSSSDAIEVMEIRCTCRYVCRLPNFLLRFLLICSAYTLKLDLIRIAIWKQFSFSLYHC